MITKGKKRFETPSKINFGFIDEHLPTGSELPVVVERTVEVRRSDVETGGEDPSIVTSIDDVGDIGKGDDPSIVTSIDDVGDIGKGEDPSIVTSIVNVGDIGKGDDPSIVTSIDDVGDIGKGDDPSIVTAIDDVGDIGKGVVDCFMVDSSGCEVDVTDALVTAKDKKAIM